MKTYTEKELETLINEVNYFKNLNEKLELDKKELTQQLALCSVVKHSELLLAFGKELLPRKQHMMLDKHITLFLEERSK